MNAKRRSSSTGATRIVLVLRDEVGVRRARLELLNRCCAPPDSGCRARLRLEPRRVVERREVDASPCSSPRRADPTCPRPTGSSRATSGAVLIVGRQVGDASSCASSRSRRPASRSTTPGCSGTSACSRCSPDTTRRTSRAVTSRRAVPCASSSCGDARADRVDLARQDRRRAESDRIGERRNPDARRERRRLVLHVDDVRLPLAPRALDARATRCRSACSCRGCCRGRCTSRTAPLDGRGRARTSADWRGTSSTTMSCPSGLIDGQRKKIDVVEDRLHLRLGRARKQLVGELRRVLRPGDLRRVQPAADVDDRASLAREVVRCASVRFPGCARRMLISRIVSSRARLAGEEMIAAVQVFPYDVLPTVIRRMRLLAAASLWK